MVACVDHDSLPPPSPPPPPGAADSEVTEICTSYPVPSDPDTDGVTPPPLSRVLADAVPVGVSAPAPASDTATMSLKRCFFSKCPSPSSQAKQPSRHRPSVSPIQDRNVYAASQVV